ncbi:MAG: hypothetical protein FWH53_06490 [Leptospirales bacterium]|nr:hypothetical protein [Leptospirales bacterium]
MRSKKTNFFQISVLVTGVIFILLGIAFSTSPITTFKIFNENVSAKWNKSAADNEFVSDDVIKNFSYDSNDLIRDDEFVAPLYLIVRSFGILLIFTGFLMILPIFDPLKYRIIAYSNGVLFPFISSIIFLKNGLFIGVKKEGASGDYIHLLIVILGIIFIVLSFMVFSALILTRKDALEGKE